MDIEKIKKIFEENHYIFSETVNETEPMWVLYDEADESSYMEFWFHRGEFRMFFSSVNLSETDLKIVETIKKLLTLRRQELAAA